MPDHNNKQAKGGPIGSTLACDPRDLSSSPARANLYKHIFIKRKLYCYTMYYEWYKIRGIPIAIVYTFNQHFGANLKNPCFC